MLRNMITDSDVRKLKTVFATKKDFQEVKQDLGAVKQDLNKTKKVVFDIAKEVVNIKHNISQLATKEEILNFKSEVLDRMDKVYGEVVNMRQEQSIHGQRHDDIEKEVRSHSKRLDKIEAVSII